MIHEWFSQVMWLARCIVGLFVHCLSIELLCVSFLNTIVVETVAASPIIAHRLDRYMSSPQACGSLQMTINMNT
jgi:hypothetical protein